jgi:hypothetical protein
MKWAWVFAVAAFVVPRAALADFHLPEHGVGVGATVAYGHARDLDGGLLVGVDAAAAYRIFWAGAGARVFEPFEPDERKVLPYLEVGLWVLVNIGVGYTVDVNSGDTSASGPHFFIGVPLPFTEGFDGFLYAEPYYRATYADVGTLHEGGAFLKWARWD